jgi:protein kinase-like protein
MGSQPLDPFADTRLARLLHERGRLPLPLLLSLLEEARRSAGRSSLAQLISREGLAGTEEIADWLGALEPQPSAAPPDRWRAGDTVAGLEIADKLGQGGMGAVYRARDLSSGALVAVKTLGASADTEMRIRFGREGEAQAAVDAHPNVVRVHRAGVAEGRAFLVMELAEGGDLTARLNAGPLPPREAAALVQQLAEGLSHVHAQGILHRDLKPNNVVFDGRGTPKLADFGLARAEGADTLTQTGTLLGTPNYMAPEQVQAKPGSIGEAADVYGLGALLYHCLVGAPPFGGSLYEVLLAVLETPPPPLSGRGSQIPKALEKICLRALEKEPGLRQPSARALAEELRAFLADEGAPPPLRFAALALSGLALTLLALAGWSLWAWASPPQDQPAGASPGDSLHQARASQRSARRLLLRGELKEALTEVDAALTQASGSELEPELQALRCQLLLAQGELEELPGALPEVDVPLFRLAQTRIELERQAAKRDEVLAWNDLQERATALARTAISARGTPWLRDALREQVANVLLTLVLQCPKGSREVLEPWISGELPALLGGDDPRIQIAWSLVALSRRDEFSGKSPALEHLQGLDELEPRWRANLEALRILRKPHQHAAKAAFARMAKRGPPLFGASDQVSTPFEVLARLKIGNEVAEQAEFRAFKPLEEARPIDAAAFQIALAHREHAVALVGGVLLDRRYANNARVELEELLACVGEPIEGPVPEGRGQFRLRSRLVRAESALDRGDAGRARHFLDAIHAKSAPLDARTLRARLVALEGDRSAADSQLDRLAQEEQGGFVPTRTVEVTRKILAGQDPRRALREALGR